MSTKTNKQSLFKSKTSLKVTGKSERKSETSEQIIDWLNFTKDFVKFNKQLPLSERPLTNKQLIEIILKNYILSNKTKVKLYHSELYRVLDKLLKEGLIKTEKRNGIRYWFAV